MLKRLQEGRRRWYLFKYSDQGHRFQDRYRRARQRRQSGEAPGWVRPGTLLVGALLVVGGFVLLPTPGPSYIIVVLGLWMMAGQLLFLARLFDWLEVRLRRAARGVKGRWQGLSVAAKVAVVVFCSAALAYGAYALIS
jgi:hypothetical protein